MRHPLRGSEEACARLYPMHTNTWFYMTIPGSTASADIKTVSYRYATYRTTSLIEPIQDHAAGSCEAKVSADAVANYVTHNAAGLAQAVTTHAAAANAVPGASEGGSIRVSGVVCVVASLAVAGLVLVGWLRERAARVQMVL